MFDHLNVPVYVNLRERVSITLAKLQTVAEVFNYFAFGTGKCADNDAVIYSRSSIDTLDAVDVISPYTFFFIAC